MLKTYIALLLVVASAFAAPEPAVENEIMMTFMFGWVSKLILKIKNFNLIKKSPVLQVQFNILLPIFTTFGTTLHL